MSSLDIIGRHETFKHNGTKLSYHRVEFVVKHDQKYYLGYLKDRKAELTRFSELQDCQEIITKDRGPEPLSHWTIAKPSDSDYIKRPRLEEYLDPMLETRMSREIEVWEVIRRSPNPGLAVYHGCILSEARVEGLCFTQYDQTLKECVDPGRLNKKDFIRSGRSLVIDDMRQWLQTIKEGLQHLHTLGFCHNDLTPSNIMVKDNRAVIIDMDSACRIGESLKGTKRTYGWTDINVHVATTDNDFKALQEIETWLFGSVDDLLLDV